MYNFHSFTKQRYNPAMQRQARPGIVTILLFPIVILFFSVPFRVVHTTSDLQQQDPTAISVVLVIDNSCSMFPREQIPPDLRATTCAQSGQGNDPLGLRFDGAELFVARLGQAEANTEQYQLGIVSLGDENAQVIRNLERINDEQRNIITQAIARQSNPQGATEIDAALERAYTQLDQNAIAENLPVIVLITDGAPVDRATGSFSEAIWSDIERLLRTNSNVPVFVLFLQDQNNNPLLEQQYASYRQRWDNLATELPYLSVRDIAAANQLVATYNDIIAQLQNTTPLPVLSIQAGEAQPFEVSKFTQRVTITIYRRDDDERVEVNITDPNGVPVEADQPGVRFWSGEDNSFDVISILPERLDLNGARNGAWTIRSTTDVDVLIDERGAYTINLLEPDVDRVRPNTYQVRQQQPTNQVVTFRLSLFDPQTGVPIPERDQPLSVDVIPPDAQGARQPQPVVEDILPNADGVYSFSYNPGARLGQFRFIIEAGRGLIVQNDSADFENPITRANVLLDVGDTPYITAVRPESIVCRPAMSPSNMTVEVGDWQKFSSSDDITVRASFQNQNNQPQIINFTAAGNGTFTADLAALCTPLLADRPCGEDTRAPLTILVSGSLPTDPAFQDRADRMVTVQAAPCAITPTETPVPPPGGTATAIIPPGPTPTGDEPGPIIFGRSLSAYMLPGIIILGLAIGGIVLYIRRNSIPRPEGYINVFRQGKPGRAYVLKNYRARTIIIGSDKKAHIQIAGLKPEEFQVVCQKTPKGNRTIVKGTRLDTEFEDVAQRVDTSNADVYLCVGLDASKLRC
jgi:uncharacterized protein YegL